MLTNLASKAGADRMMRGVADESNGYNLRTKQTEEEYEFFFQEDLFGTDRMTVDFANHSLYFVALFKYRGQAV